MVYLMGSVSSMSTTLPEPTVGGPPANSMMRAAQLPAGRHPAIMPAATCTALPVTITNYMVHASHVPDWIKGALCSVMLQAQTGETKLLVVTLQSLLEKRDGHMSDHACAKLSADVLQLAHYMEVACPDLH